tara:strand:- start:165 stop:515 length:351 start_codon:yes stop_codon:yes gene_type:complete
MAYRIIDAKMYLILKGRSYLRDSFNGKKQNVIEQTLAIHRWTEANDDASPVGMCPKCRNIKGDLYDPDDREIHPSQVVIETCVDVPYLHVHWNCSDCDTDWTDQFALTIRSIEIPL